MKGREYEQPQNKGDILEPDEDVVSDARGQYQITRVLMGSTREIVEESVNMAHSLEFP